MKILVCNAGSSSLKFSLFDGQCERQLADGVIDWTTTPVRLVRRLAGQPEVVEKLALQSHGEAAHHVVSILKNLLPEMNELQAVGHRVVHGGSRFPASVLVSPDVKRAIGELAELAPLHNPASLEVIEAMEKDLPHVPQVAAFDTAFHATLPEVAWTYPIPRAWTREWGVRRYGFHGLSHSYCAARAAEMIGRKNLRLIIAHLGHGASISAVRDGVCVETSMGFTPLEGLMMATRSGSIDPGLLIYLLRRKGMSADQLDHALNYESGLLGVSGISSDMRQILAAAHSPDARLALDMYIHRVRQTIGAMAVTLGGVDGLVFTAGVGENAPEIRQRVCQGLDFLDLRLNSTANKIIKPDADIALPWSHGRILVIATREDLTVMREVRRLISLRLVAPTA